MLEAVEGSDLELKQRQFNAAMELYEERSIYRVFGYLVAASNLALQLYLLFAIAPLKVGAWSVSAAFVAAFVLADFANGLIHMVMDNCDDYGCAAGPLIAAFHLHHKTPKYRVRPLHLVYFMESGAKVWLVPYLAAVALLLEVSRPHPALAHLLVYFGVLSSVAEVSHYLCHTSTGRVTLFLGRIGLLLSKRHHARHHTLDNNNYAFLNGFTDPLLNAIARRCFKGYKGGTDLHFARYEGAGTANR